MNAAAKSGEIVAFSLIWSSAFVIGKLAVDDLHPAIVLSLRFALSTAVLAPFWITSLRGTFDRRALARGVALGILNNTIYLGATFAAIRSISPALVIVIVSCAPFVTVLMGAAAGRERLDIGKVAGMAVGFAGVLVIVGGQGALHGDVSGVLLAAGGTLSFCAGTVVFSGRGAQVSILQTNFYQSAAAAVSLAAIALVLHAPLVMPSPTTVAVVVYLALVVTIVGMALWLHLIRAVGPSTAASVHLLNPAVGLVLSFLILGRAIGPTDVVGTAVIAAGLLIVLRRRP